MQRMGESAHPVAEKNQAVANHAEQVNEMKKKRGVHIFGTPRYTVEVGTEAGRGRIPLESIRANRLCDYSMVLQALKGNSTDCTWPTI